MNNFLAPGVEIQGGMVEVPPKIVITPFEKFSLLKAPYLLVTKILSHKKVANEVIRL